MTLLIDTYLEKHDLRLRDGFIIRAYFPKLLERMDRIRSGSFVEESYFSYVGRKRDILNRIG